MNHPILVENEKKRLNIRLPLLICFSMFAAWQMGMVYFSGQTMSVDGRTPLPVKVGDVTAIIASGYILSIVVMILLSRFIVWMERLTCAAALLSALALFLPLPPQTLAFVLYVHYFCCCFMIGFETAVMIGLFTENTAILHLTAAYGVSMILVAALHNDFIDVPFSYFRMFTVAACAMQLLFYCKLPGNVWPAYVKKSDKIVARKMLFVGIFMWAAMACFVILFGIAVAETVSHGVFVFYLASAVASFVMLLLWKCFGIRPLSVFTIATVIGALGSIGAISSLFIPGVALAACAFLGIASMLCWMNPLICILLVKKYPSRFISPAVIGSALVAVLIHTALLNALRDNTAVLYLAYLAIAVSMVVLFLVLRPYLEYAFSEPTEKNETQSAGIETPPANSADSSPAQDWRKMLQANAYDPLSQGELDVAGCIMKGYRTEEIARVLPYTLESVKTYRKRLYSKLQINRSRQLFLRAEKIVKGTPEEDS
jgi:DNA-binding CsgD family transcriptional regulator